MAEDEKTDKPDEDGQKAEGYTTGPPKRGRR